MFAFYFEVNAVSKITVFEMNKKSTQIVESNRHIYTHGSWFENPCRKAFWQLQLQPNRCQLFSQISPHTDIFYHDCKEIFQLKQKAAL